MRMKLVFILLLSFCAHFLLAQSQEQSIYLKLDVELTPLSKPLPDSISVKYTSFHKKPWSSYTSETKHKNNTIWTIFSREPVVVKLSGIVDMRYRIWLLEPGDSITVHWRKGMLHFSGRGAEKLNMNNEIYALLDAIPKPSNPELYTLKSVEDFTEWSDYLDRKLALCEYVMSGYKDKVTPLAIYNTKLLIYRDVEDMRWQKFTYLRKDEFNLSRQTVAKIYNDHFCTSHAQWLWEQPLSAVLGLPVRARLYREYNFPASIKDIAPDKTKLALISYELAKKEFKGEGLDYSLAEFLTKVVMDELDFPKEFEPLLEKYYDDNERAQEYKSYVKEYERKARILKVNKKISAFTVYDKNLKLYTNADMAGRVVVLNFIKADDKGSVRVTESLKGIEDSFKRDAYVKFIHLPVKLQPDSVVKRFNLSGFPAIFVIDFTGRLLSSSFIDTSLNANKIKEIVLKRSYIARQEDWQNKSDGPYIVKDGNDTKVFQVVEGKLNVQSGKNKSFSIATDEPRKTFSVTLKDQYRIEPSIFPKPEKLIAFSDIEGEFEPLRMLLQKNKVIDEQYNWIFGKGHVVFVGDMFDRGEQVTECLWLMYSLEEKAKAAGGYIHFILGNHEIMNLSGDHKYVRPKYREITQMIGRSLVEIYGQNSELGKWLRSKNIVEKVGDILFMHAGISKQINDLNLSVNQLNELARPWYDKADSTNIVGDTRLRLLFDRKLSPFWYRDYFLESQGKVSVGSNVLMVSYKTTENVIDEVLSHYEVNKIVTGHTQFEGVKDNDRGKYLTVHYDGKVVNLDTRHKYGYSEALLVENGKYYAVNKNGEKRELHNTSTQNSQIVYK